MVKPEVWQEAKLAYDAGVIHLRCLEKRLTRLLRIEDFDTTSPMNADIFFAYDMGRLRGGRS